MRKRLSSLWHGAHFLATDLAECLLRHLPGRMGESHLGYRLRQRFWRRQLAALGENVLIQENVHLFFPHNIAIGNNVSITTNCILSAGVPPDSRITIGDDVFIGPSTHIFACNHDYSTENIKRDARYLCKPVRVGNNVWIGAMVGILPGVTIGDGAVIGMGAIVSRDVPPNTIHVGNPARMVKAITR